MLALLLAGYFAQHYLPPPKPKIVGIDLGMTVLVVSEDSSRNCMTVPMH